MAIKIPKFVLENSQKINELYDSQYLLSCHRNLFKRINKYYFRSRMVFSREILTESTPSIFIGNHSGMAFSWDGLIFFSTIIDHLYSKPSGKTIRALVDPSLLKQRLMEPFLIDKFWAKTGCVDATYINFETMMNQEETDVFVFPEGNEGLAKGFDKKYQIQPLSNSFVLMGLKYNVYVNPVYVINGEYLNPHSYRNDKLNRLVNKIGIPFLPFGLSLLILVLQPWMFYFVFPANLTYVIGAPFKISDFTDSTAERISVKEANRVAEVVRLEMQKELNRYVGIYGKSPYHLKSLIRVNLKNIIKSPFCLPLTWPFLFAEHDRQYKKTGRVVMKDSYLLFLKAFILNIHKIFLFLPVLGWVYMLLVGLKKR